MALKKISSVLFIAKNTHPVVTATIRIHNVAPINHKRDCDLYRRVKITFFIGQDNFSLIEMCRYFFILFIFICVCHP